ncbi:transposase [Paenibacillus xylanexedens]|nr:transposase [Paenibacillus xylanexedens]
MKRAKQKTTRYAGGGNSSEKRSNIIEIFRRLCKYKRVEIIKGHKMPDHVHMLVAILTKIAISTVR